MSLSDRVPVRFAAALALGILAAAPASAEDSPRTLYVLRCSGCHGLDGSGSTLGRVPALPGMDKFLRHPDGVMFLSNVPGIKNSGLSDADIARLLNWAVHYWGEDPGTNAATPVTAEEVGRFRHMPPDDISVLRANIAADLAAQGVEISSPTGN